MKIAVAYENGAVFQHFGHTESFKVYEVEDGKVLSSEILSANGGGHDALSLFLAQQGVGVVICGGIGQGAEDALAAVGIEICSGVQGDADAAVEAYLSDALESAGVNCDHHQHEGGCNGGCAGCSGGCHSQPSIQGPNVGKTCKTHYRGTFNDGTEFDSSYNRGEPLEFICGAGMMIPGFDAAVATMEVGQSVDIHLMPDEAYGMPDPRAIFTLEISQLPGSEELKVGEQVALYDNMGRPIPVTVTARTDTTITFDANHEMAGKELNFHIELVEVC